MKEYSSHRRNAFTLIELLVSISLIGILCVVIIAVVSRSRESARKVQCVSNLQQIGKALHLFLSDNSNVFPGPLVARQRSFTAPYFARPNALPLTPPLTRRTALIDWLAPYIGIEVTPGSAYTPAHYSDLFICPSGSAEMISKGVPKADRYYYNTIIDPIYRVFGYSSKSGYTAPLRLSAVDVPSSTMILIDMDNELKPGSPTSPEKPSHGLLRNVLFLDGHVESLSNDQLP